MAAFCHFWRCIPADIETMEPREYEALVRFQNKYVAEQRKQAEKAKRRR